MERLQLLGLDGLPGLFTASMHIHAAIDANRLTGHEVAVIGREKDHCAHEILRVLIALNRATLSSVC